MLLNKWQTPLSNHAYPVILLSVHRHSKSPGFLRLSGLTVDELGWNPKVVAPCSACALPGRLDCVERRRLDEEVVHVDVVPFAIDLLDQRHDRVVNGGAILAVELEAHRVAGFHLVDGVDFETLAGGLVAVLMRERSPPPFVADGLLVEGEIAACTVLARAVLGEGFQPQPDLLHAPFILPFALSRHKRISTVR